MADTVTLDYLKTQVKDRADQTNSFFIEDALLTQYIDLSYGAFYDLLIEEENYYFGTSINVTVVSPNSSIPLSSLTNFYRLTGLDDISSPDNPLTVRKFNFAERNDYNNGYIGMGRYSDVFYQLYGSTILLTPPSFAPRPYKAWFIPHRTILTTGSDTVDSVNGWIEWVILDAAIKCMVKEESDIRPLQTLQQSQYERITKGKGKRDVAGPDKIARVRNKRQGRIYDSRMPPGF